MSGSRRLFSAGTITTKRGGGANTAKDYKCGGNKKQGLSGQSLTKAGPTLNVDHKCAQRSVMYYNNGITFCINPMSGGVGRTGGAGRSFFSKQDGLHCSSYKNCGPRRKNVGMFCYGFKTN